MNELSEIEKSGVFNLKWLNVICCTARESRRYRDYLIGIYLTCPYNAPYADEIDLLIKVYCD